MWIFAKSARRKPLRPVPGLRLFPLLGLLVVPFTALPAFSAVGDIAVVVRPDVPAQDLSLTQIRDLVMGERQFWDSNLRLTLLIQPPSAREREVLLKAIYRMNEAQFRQYWISKVFRAEAVASPKIVYSNQMATQLVATIPGSVAFIEASEVPKGLKVLKIDGKLPGEKGYPLH